MAGLLGRDDMIQSQVRIAHGLGIEEFVLGFNHMGDNQNRFENAMSLFGSTERIWLYNMPTFDPQSLGFIEKCMGDMRVQGIKDSSR